MIKNKNRETRRRHRIRIDKYTYDSIYVHNEGYITPYWKHSRRQRWLKKIYNRRIRRNKDVLSGGQYKKACEYWWELW